MDFSDPHGGNGAFDRKAASIKVHVRRHINEGHDVTTARELAQVMMSSGGIKGVRVAPVAIDASSPTLTNSYEVRVK